MILYPKDVKVPSKEEPREPETPDTEVEKDTTQHTQTIRQPDGTEVEKETEDKQ